MRLTPEFSTHMPLCLDSLLEVKKQLTAQSRPKTKAGLGSSLRFGSQTFRNTTSAFTSPRATPFHVGNSATLQDEDLTVRKGNTFDPASLISSRRGSHLQQMESKPQLESRRSKEPDSLGVPSRPIMFKLTAAEQTSGAATPQLDSDAPSPRTKFQLSRLKNAVHPRNNTSSQNAIEVQQDQQLQSVKTEPAKYNPFDRSQRFSSDSRAQNYTTAESLHTDLTQPVKTDFSKPPARNNPSYGFLPRELMGVIESSDTASEAKQYNLKGTYRAGNTRSTNISILSSRKESQNNGHFYSKVDRNDTVPHPTAESFAKNINQLTEHNSSPLYRDFFQNTQRNVKNIRSRAVIQKPSSKVAMSHRPSKNIANYLSHQPITVDKHNGLPKLTLSTSSQNVNHSVQRTSINNSIVNAKIKW